MTNLLKLYNYDERASDNADRLLTFVLVFHRWRKSRILIVPRVLIRHIINHYIMQSPISQEFIHYMSFKGNTKLNKYKNSMDCTISTNDIHFDTFKRLAYSYFKIESLYKVPICENMDVLNVPVIDYEIKGCTITQDYRLKVDSFRVWNNGKFTGEYVDDNIPVFELTKKDTHKNIYKLVFCIEYTQPSDIEKKTIEATVIVGRNYVRQAYVLKNEQHFLLELKHDSPCFDVIIVIFGGNCYLIPIVFPNN